MLILKSTPSLPPKFNVIAVQIKSGEITEMNLDAIIKK